jgi:hypothetical protein
VLSCEQSPSGVLTPYSCILAIVKGRWLPQWAEDNATAVPPHCSY